MLANLTNRRHSLLVGKELKDEVENFTLALGKWPHVNIVMSYRKNSNGIATPPVSAGENGRRTSRPCSRSQGGRGVLLDLRSLDKSLALCTRVSSVSDGKPGDGPFTLPASY